MFTGVARLGWTRLTSFSPCLGSDSCSLSSLGPGCGIFHDFGIFSLF